MYSRYKTYLPTTHCIVCIGMHDMLGCDNYMLCFQLLGCLTITPVIGRRAIEHIIGTGPSSSGS
jgi:hypothetical protein